MIPSRRCLAVILAAGEGTRMRSAKPKVLHEIAGRSMLAHVLAAVQQAGALRIAVVVGPERQDVANEALRLVPQAEIFVQAERRGTAHAVLAARRALEAGADDILIAYADTPLVLPDTFDRLRAPLASGAAVAVLGFRTEAPTGYGRLIVEGEDLIAIREEKDASLEERAITLCNAGFMALRGSDAIALLQSIGNDNANGEFYLTDAVEAARARGGRAAIVEAPESEVQGVNDRVQLAAAEAVMQERLRRAALLSGVTMIAPETVFLSFDSRLGRDVVIQPHVVIGPGVTVEDGATIYAFSHLEGAHIGKGAGVGPFARLRPGAKLGEKAKVGNFVEIKNTELGQGAKVGHLTYLGDASVGRDANIGAGTITCNYDGFNKYRTLIGAGAFIGSNSALVAPVKIGEGAYIGSGSVITGSVPDNALGIGRARQIVKEGWGEAFRERAEGLKKEQK